MSAESIYRKLGRGADLGADADNRARNQPRADMGPVGSSAAPPIGERVALSPMQHERFHALYREHFDFVFRNLRRLGVPAASIDDALQEVYLVVLRRIDDYREGSQARAWLFAIAVRVAGNYRRTQRRRGDVVPFVETAARSTAPGPFELTARVQASRVLHDFLGTLDDAKRAIFVMAELEQMTAPEIARALSMNLNTVYSRLQAARAEFARMVSALARKEGASPGTDGSHG